MKLVCYHYSDDIEDPDEVKEIVLGPFKELRMTSTGEFIGDDKAVAQLGYLGDDDYELVILDDDLETACQEWKIVP